jgi:flagellin-specific chaperone FliS
MIQKKLQVIQTNKDIDTYTGLKAVKVTKISHAKRLLSKLILQLQRGDITGQLAKDLTYLLSTFVNIFKTAELEDRIKKLEELQNVKRPG